MAGRMWRTTKTHLDAVGGAWEEVGGADQQLPNVGRVEAVHVLVWVDRHEHLPGAGQEPTCDRCENKDPAQ